MSTGLKFVRFAGIIVLSLGSLAASSQNQHKTHKAKPKKELPPLPSGPTGPIQQIPLDTMAPLPPRVTYEKGQLSIVAINSTLGDILRAVRKQTGADIDVPDAKERVVTHLGPGPAQEVIAELLNGSRYNYVLLGSAQDPGVLTKVVLVARAGPDKPNSNPATPQTVGVSPGATTPEQPQADMADANEADASTPEENTDESTGEVASEPEQQQPGQPEQPAVKTPQELLQEMQQRQLQLQQQQQAGQPPAPAPGVPVQQRPQENQ